MAGLVWIASYPKSGNTWVRLVLSHYLGHAPGPVDINAIDIGGAASWRLLDDYGVGEPSEYTAEEFDRLRPALYRARASAASSPVLLKVHDAWGPTPGGEPLFPPEITAATLYVVRHPADVAVSYAFHDGLTMDEAVAFLCSDQARLAGAAGQGRQRLGRWCDHVTSWLDDAGSPVCLLRYEDMLHDPLAEMTRAAQAAGVAVNRARLAASLDACRFSALQTQERESGFIERGARARAPFFREGRAGGWRAHLTDAHVQQLRDCHGDVMKRLGYMKEGE